MPYRCGILVNAADGASLPLYADRSSVILYEVDKRLAIGSGYVEIDELNTWLNLEVA